jgi:hypothetical protein
MVILILVTLLIMQGRLENGFSFYTVPFHFDDLFGRFVDPRSIETQTNPIDRSIALLLFHQSPNQVTGALDDTLSLKSHVSLHFLISAA